MLGPLFVIFGAALWATDTWFRLPMTQQLSAITIVFLEHGVATIAALLLAVVAVRFQWSNLFLSYRHLFASASAGILGSALASICFTSSFLFINPTIAILLQKVQPIFVIVLARLFLAETLPRYFWPLSIVAIGAAFFMSFPHGIHMPELKSADLKGTALALLAALFWAKSTILSRYALQGTPHPSVVTFWRFFFGLLMMSLLAAGSQQTHLEYHFVFSDPKSVQSILMMALIPGFIGVSLYYQGLSRVPASVATILELSFPLTAIFFNQFAMGLSIEPVQMMSGFVLILCMAGMSYLVQSRSQPK